MCNTPADDRERHRKFGAGTLGADPRWQGRTRYSSAARRPAAVAVPGRARDNAGSALAAAAGLARCHGNARRRTSAATAVLPLGRQRCNSVPAAGTDGTTVRTLSTGNAGTDSAAHERSNRQQVLDQGCPEMKIEVGPRERLLPTVKPRREGSTSLRGACQTTGTSILPSINCIAKYATPGGRALHALPSRCNRYDSAIPTIPEAPLWLDQAIKVAHFLVALDTRWLEPPGAGDSGRYADAWSASTIASKDRCRARIASGTSSARRTVVWSHAPWAVR